MNPTISHSGAGLCVVTAALGQEGGKPPSGVATERSGGTLYLAVLAVLLFNLSNGV